MNWTEEHPAGDEKLPEIDPEQLFNLAPEVLAQLAKLTREVMESTREYHVAQSVKNEAAAAITLILSLHKETT